jgi:hypothetical protein
MIFLRMEIIFSWIYNSSPCFTVNKKACHHQVAESSLRKPYGHFKANAKLLALSSAAVRLTRSLTFNLKMAKNILKNNLLLQEEMLSCKYLCDELLIFLIT